MTVTADPDVTPLGALGAPMSGADLLALAPGADEAAPPIVVRDPRTAVGALMRAWETRRFAIDPQPEGWWGDPWSFALIDDWRDLLGKPLSTVCARQWLTLQLAAMREAPEAGLVSFEEILRDPRGVEERLREAGLEATVTLQESRDPHVRPYAIDEVLSGLQANADLLEEYLDLVEQRGITAYREPLPEPVVEAVDARKPSAGTPWHSSFTSTVAQLLHQANASLIVTTYKAGRVIVARAEDGSRLDTHFTSMERPMGTAVGGHRLAVGAADSVVVYASHDAGRRVPVSPTPDRVLVPKAVCFTGDISIHDMGWDAQGDLWFVNTRFSCLSKLDLYSSFTCEWKPEWITALAGEDRCHLNGLAMVDGQPKYVTALARTDSPGGWREHKGTSGVIVDVTSDEVIAEGLSMPHSPRWHDGSLWFLQSGTGSLNRLRIDGTVEEITRLPGFTRGLAFLGRYALVGLSQVRESVFSGLPVTESALERNCGVWVVDTRTGQTVGFVKFTGSVTEIFEVNVMHARWPHIGEPGDLTRTSYSLDPEVLQQMTTAAADETGQTEGEQRDNQ